MTEVTPAAATRSAWRDYVMLGLAAIAPTFVIGGALRYDGGRDQTVADQGRRIVELERRADSVDEINQRLARIEGKLDIASPPGGRP